MEKSPLQTLDAVISAVMTTNVLLTEEGYKTLRMMIKEVHVSAYIPEKVQNTLNLTKAV